MPEWLRKLVTTKEGRVVIGQPPNVPVLIAAGLSVLAFLLGFLAPGAALWVGRAASLAWIYWAALELFTGVNGFRRILGGVVFVLSILGLFRQ